MTQNLRSKDTVSEALALYNFVCHRTRYLRDPRTVELVRAPWITLDEVWKGHIPGVDCLPMGTLLLNNRHEFVAIEDIQPGMKIWGRDRWSEVQAAVFKGVQSVDTIFLNNGSQLTLTPGHKLYVRDCGHHNGRPCPSNAYNSCKKGDRTNFVRIAASEVEPGMVLLSPNAIDYGTEEQDPRRALIEGLYLSDGWSQKKNGKYVGGFSISGQDGCPKEEQKRRVESICKELGIKTSWRRKAIYVWATPYWNTRMQQMGTRAIDKHALGISLQKEAAAALLEGIMADAGQNTHGDGKTFTTTSRSLFLQTRMLAKMAGLSCSERYIVHHGGLGQHPIWRLGLRPNAIRADGKANKVLRIKAVERNTHMLPVWDIQTDDHYVYLPEADTTVSNCDDLSSTLCALNLAAGAETRVATVAFQNMVHRGERQYSHVFCQVKEPRTGRWMTLDPVAGDKTQEMRGRVLFAKYWPIA